ncbi:phosphorylase [Methylomonas sp. AM2-LC]|uniref:phosphorylase family protein n=1 Tax=Methylomonas sp. AM2-LC TaxID=3153301 RepID=UPI003267D29E
MNINQNAQTRWIVGIVVALPEELATLTKIKLLRGGYTALNDNILVAYAGTGATNAESAANLLVSKGAKALISWGCAAGLSDELKPGDLFIPKQVLSEQKQILDADKEWLQHLQILLTNRMRLITDLLVESSVIVGSSMKKKRIHQETRALALDMETVAVFKTANRSNIPCLAIRAIADPVDMNLPLAVVNSLNTEGHVEIDKLLRYILRHPSEIPGLIKLGLHFNAAAKTLKIIAHQLNDIINFKKQVGIQ